MSSDLRGELFRGLDEFTPARREFLHRAYAMLPTLERPRVLDVGCGRGGPTLELARLGGGEVVGVDIDRGALAELTARAAAEGLSARVRAVQASMAAMDFPAGSFDVIWAEGSAHAIGLVAALGVWRRLLRPAGHLVIHEMCWLRPDPAAELAGHWRRVFPGIRTVPEYEAEIPRHGYAAIASFPLPEEFWWENYYEPLARRIAELSREYRALRAAGALLREQEREIELYRKHRGWYGSAYLLMRRQD